MTKCGSKDTFISNQEDKQVNSIRHYHLTFKRSLEQELFHQLHTCRIHNPSIKEFKESFAFGRAVQVVFQKERF